MDILTRAENIVNLVMDDLFEREEFQEDIDLMEEKLYQDLKATLSIKIARYLASQPS